MTSPAAPQMPAAPPAIPSRPATLTVGILLAIAASFVVVAASISMLVSGRAAVEEFAKAELATQFGGQVPDSLTGLLGPQIDEAYSILQTRAIAALIFAALFGLFALLAVRGSRVARIALMLGSLANASVGLFIFADSEAIPGLSAGGALAGAVLGVIGMTCYFLPASGRYLKAVRTANT